MNGETVTVTLSWLVWRWAHGDGQGRVSGDVVSGVSPMVNALKADDLAALWRVVHLAEEQGDGPTVAVQLGGLVDRGCLDRLLAAGCLETSISTGVR